MSVPTSGSQNGMTLVRADQRRSCEVTARLSTGVENREQVEFSESQDLEVTIVDYSNGGLGLRSSRFVPQGCLVQVRVAGTGASAEAECAGRVQRVMMMDRTPSYYLGLSFTGDGGSTNKALAAIRSASGVQGD